MINEIELGICKWQGIKEGIYGIRDANLFSDYSYYTIARKMYLSGEEYIDICKKYGGKMSYIASMVFDTENQCLSAIEELCEIRDSRIIMNKLMGK